MENGLTSVTVETAKCMEFLQIPEILKKISSVPIDKETILQERLNLANRERVSIFPWRGQFSPELIEILLEKYSQVDSIILDPFAGSGSTLFEAARKDMPCFGAEINPAAVEMARTVCFANLDAKSRDNCINEAEQIIRKFSPRFNINLTSSNRKGKTNVIKQILTDSSKDPLVYNMVVNTMLRSVILRKSIRLNRLWKAFKIHGDIIRKLPYSEKCIDVFHNDARSLPLKKETIDLVITSPPYINVFNYHQNYRPLMELINWNLLKVAKSEIGSNRKHRGNRFLTVIQYAIDMLQALTEMKRVVRENGRIIIIIGRESKIRTVSFENYKIIATLAIGGAGFKLITRQERQFTTRFGESIYEDILSFVPTKNSLDENVDFGRKTGVHFLEGALSSAPKLVQADIRSAINDAGVVNASPLFNEQDSKSQTEEENDETN